MVEQVKTIPIESLRPPKIQLRPIHTESVEFMEMRDSIRDGGLLNSIAVRPCEGGQYEIVDGFYRYTCCKLLEWSHMPCIVKEMTDEQCLAAQVRANAIRPETRPVEFAKQLRRIQKACPDITLSEIAVMVGKSAAWVKKQLLLLNLVNVARDAVDRDEISLMNAYMLAKLPRSVQQEYVESAKTLDIAQFKALATSAIRHFMEAARQGSLEYWFQQEFEPTPHLRPLKDVLREIEAREEAVIEIATGSARTPLDGWVLALTWAANLDPRSIERQRERARVRHKRQTIERIEYTDEIDLEVSDD